MRFEEFHQPAHVSECQRLGQCAIDVSLDAVADAVGYTDTEVHGDKLAPIAHLAGKRHALADLGGPLFVWPSFEHGPLAGPFDEIRAELSTTAAIDHAPPQGCGGAASGYIPGDLACSHPTQAKARRLDPFQRRSENRRPGAPQTGARTE